MILKII